MKLHKNGIEVVEREDMEYTITENTWSSDPKKRGRYFPEIHYYPENRRWDTVEIGGCNGYKTYNGALNAIKKHASARGLTLVLA